MAKAICIIGESGAGKTTSLRNLDPKETYYIDADKKGSASVPALAFLAIS